MLKYHMFLFACIFLITCLNFVFSNILVEVVKPSYTLPSSLLETFSEYIKLEEIEDIEPDSRPVTCNYYDIVSKKSEEIVTQVIFAKNCIPDVITFKEILENGWEKLVIRIVKELYLNNKIDPSQTLYNYIGSNEDKLKVFYKLVLDYNSLKPLNIKYSYDNTDDQIKMRIKMPDFSFTPEYYSFFCKEDLFIIHTIFKSRGHLYRLKESNRLFDNIEGDCKYSYNYFTYSFEIILNKKNKLKIWDTLFKKLN